MNFRRIHFCGEIILEKFIHSNWIEEYNSHTFDYENFKNRRLGLFKNILISQNNKPRPNKWMKNNSKGWNVTHQAGKGADKTDEYTTENGYSVQFVINEDSLPVIQLKDDNNRVEELCFQANWQVSALEDFTNGKNEFLKNNPNSTCVVEQFEYKSYIDFIATLFQKIENESSTEFAPFYKTYLALFDSYNKDNISNRTKTVIETTMGAMIFYMPQRVEESWSRRISYECFLECIRNNNYKKVKDHEIPRKLAAKLCLERNNIYTLNEFIKQYWNRFSSFTYVTTQENLRLVNWYLDENNQDNDGNIDYLTALNNLNINYFNFPENFNHRKINGVIKAVRDNIENLNSYISFEELKLLFHKQINQV